MNTTVAQEVIDQADADDPAVAAAEYGAEFRRDIEGYVSREALDDATVHGRRELPPIRGVSYRAFVDPSGGTQDSMTLAIGHRDGDRAILDALREVHAPFAPEQVVTEFVDLLRPYRVTRIGGDRYAGEWPREVFRKLGVAYQVCETAKSDLYQRLLPSLNSGQVELLDHPRLLAQLSNLERRTARGGRDSIDHPPRAHDDVANAAAGVLVDVLGHRSGVTTAQDHGGQQTRSLDLDAPADFLTRRCLARGLGRRIGP